jgi:transcriptional regulator with XRE-family HTH domain
MKEDPADEIQRVMDREGVTQEELRSRVSCDVSRILASVVSPTWRTIQRIAHAMGYTAYVVFKRKK